MTYRRYSATKIGLLLQEAALVSPAQIEVALFDQASYGDLRLGEILALRGWIEQETADFFAERWYAEIELEQRNPLGYYLKSAALLNDRQIQEILKEQPHMGLRFGAIAVLKGWVRQKTIDFFLANLSPQQQGISAFVDRRRVASRQRISKVPKTIFRQGPARDQHEGKKLNVSQYAIASFFNERNLQIDETLLLFPDREAKDCDLNQALESNLSHYLEE